MANKEPKWGSPEWRTHMRRSLAQRKRAGEDIKDIEGMIDYIQEKGPKKVVKKASPKKTVVRGSTVVPTNGPGGIQVRHRSHRQRII